MKESLWGYYLILLGIMVSTVMIMVTNMTTTSQQDYYLLREITNASMIDALDYGYYRTYGEMKINTEKFVENFIRRFAEGISKTNSYKIDFYSIYENPPSVSIKVTSNTGDYIIAGDSTNIDVINTIDAILESNNTVTYSEIYYSIPYASCDESSYIIYDQNNPDDSNNYKYCQLTNRAHINLDYDSHIYDYIKAKLGLSVLDKSKIKVANVEFLSIMKTEDDLDKYRDMYDMIYKREHSINDMPDSIGSAAGFTQNIKNVNITVKQEGGEYYLGYGLDFNCEGTEKYEYYRIGTSIDNMYYIEMNDSTFISSDYSKYYYRKPSDSSDSSWFGSASKITIDNYNALSDTEKSQYIKFERAPFYDSCMIGIKYKVNFYYDNN